MKEKIINLLRWSEKYTKTDMVYLASGGFWLTFSQGANSILSLLLAVAFANLISPETYGYYKYVISIIGILSIFTLPGLNTAITREAAKNESNSFNLALKTKINFGLLGTVSSLLIAFYYFYNHRIDFALTFLLAGLFIPLMDSFYLYTADLVGKKLFKQNAIFQLISQAICVLILIATMTVSKNLTVLVTVYLISWTIVRLWFLKFSKFYRLNNKPVNPSTITYGKRLSLINVLDVIGTQIDKIIIFHFLGSVELAIYIFAMAIPNQVKGILKNIGTLILPKFTNQSLTNIKNNIYKKIAHFQLFTIIIAAVYILLAPIIFKLFFPQYLNSIFFSQIYGLIIILVPKVFFRSAFEAKKLYKELYSFKIFSFIIKITITIILIKYFGLIGAIAAQLISELMLYIYLIPLFNRSLEVDS